MKQSYRILFNMPSAAAQTLPFILAGLALLALAGCTGAVVGLAGEGAAIVATRPSDPPPPDVEHSIQPHESWCYETLGYAECYAHAQDVEPDRLVNVDPANRYPLTPRAYADEIHPPPPPPPPLPPPPVASAAPIMPSGVTSEDIAAPIPLTRVESP